ncbi:MAG TPA: hypothetical protein VFJ30_14680 [Phycisphaerae bacterium]|nr:hypothetical protein [Phycisphaerae bacterium]
MRSLLAIALAACTAAAAAQADMVVERWGRYRYTQHKEVALAAGEKGRVMTVDLSALPRKAAIYRARLVFTSGKGYEVSADRKALPLVEPYCLWFDAGEAVRGWVARGIRQGELTIARASRLRPDQVYLEIAYEGKLPEPPEQVTGVKAFHRRGQTFLTWKEVEDLAEGNEDINWGEMAPKVAECNPMVGIIPKWPQREIRYSVYRHSEPITAANIGEAEFVHDVMQGSVYAEDSIARGRQGEHGPVYLKAGQVLRRVMLAKGEFLPPGTGYHWLTAPKAGKAYYAVVTSINGVENTTAITPANSVGPVEEETASPVPMLVAEEITDLRRPEGAKYIERWYSWWCTEPLSAYPRRYDVAVGFCPQTMATPAAVTITREAWNYPIRMPDPSARQDIVLAHTMDVPIGFRMGIPHAHYGLKDFQQARWQSWPMNRQEALIRWLGTELGIDADRISVSMGAWGMMELERPDLYALIEGWGQPGVTEGFQCWDRARGVWGPPDVYSDRPDAENPYVRSDYVRYVLADPARETPFFNIYAIRSAHLTEMGWPPHPRFWRAMIDSKHPFVLHWRVKDQPVIRRDRSVPAFGNCTLDDNPGNGDLRNGLTFDAQINGYLSWVGETIVDEPGKWEMTILLDDSAPLDECRVDLTPRKCRGFRPGPGRKFQWTCTPLPRDPKAVADPAARITGAAETDRHGLVTIRQLPLRKGAQRVTIALP